MATENNSSPYDPLDWSAPWKDPIPKRWGETAAITFVSMIALYALTASAFRTFFTAVDFRFLELLVRHDYHFWSALSGLTSGGSFRPVLFLFNLPFLFLSPDDPLVYHIRNYLFTGVNILLFHRVSLRFVRTAYARVIAVGLFVVSKVHLTTIGYISIFDSIVKLMLILLTLLLFCKYTEEKGSINLGLGILFGGLAIFSDDYGFVIVIVLFVMVFVLLSARFDWSFRGAARILWPLVATVILYGAIRVVLVGAHPDSLSPYQPGISARTAIRQSLVLLSSLGNASLYPGEATGAVGAPGALAGTLGVSRNDRVKAEAVAAGMIVGLMILTVVWSRPDREAVAFAVVWVMAYLGPVFFSRSTQVFEGYEALPAIALLVAISVERLGMRWRIAWAVALGLLFVSGMVSNRAPDYPWSRMAARSETAVDALRGRGDIEEASWIVIVSEQPALWRFILGTTDHQMLARLLPHRDLSVTYAMDDVTPTSPSTVVVHAEKELLATPVPARVR